MFFVFQLVTRVPAVQLIQAALADQLKASPTLTWAWLVVLALTAGLFEEVGRYFGYRVAHCPGQVSFAGLIDSWYEHSHICVHCAEGWHHEVLVMTRGAAAAIRGAIEGGDAASGLD